MIVATLGHVDHGKSALVRALTGCDPDRLPEEKARGMTIDLGFAYRRAAHGLIGFVDVPGHQRFIRNMLAGFASLDLALLVIAADDGPMPQTREHLQVADLLGLERGAVVLTKTDRVDAQRTASVERQTRALLRGTRLASAPVFRTATLIGEGVPALLSYLDQQQRDLPPRRNRAAPTRFCIDRSFTVRGSGTVVTGTVVDGEVHVDDELVVSPSGTSIKVRRLRVHTDDVDHAVAGERCALNLVGVSVEAAARGHWLLAARLHRPTTRFDSRISVLIQAPPLADRARLKVHLGSACVDAQVVLLGSAAVEAGASALATLVLDSPLVASRDDRFVLRSAARDMTIGGGRVLDPEASKWRAAASARSDRLVALDQPHAADVLVSLAATIDGSIDTDWFGRVFRLTEAEVALALQAAGLHRLAGGYALSPRRERALAGRILAVVEAQDLSPVDQRPDAARIVQTVDAALPRSVIEATIRQLLAEGELIRTGEGFRVARRRSRLDGKALALWRRVAPRLIQAAGSAPSTGVLATRLGVHPEELLDVLQRKVAQGEVVRVGTDRFIARHTLVQLAEVARSLALRSADRRFTVAQFRDEIGTGRGLALDLLGCLDRERVTVRMGNVRRVEKDGAERIACRPLVLGKRQNWRLRHRFTRDPGRT